MPSRIYWLCFTPDSKLPDVGTTIFTVMSQLAADCDAINLSQGFPGFDPDPDLLQLVEGRGDQLRVDEPDARQRGQVGAQLVR